MNISKEIKLNSEKPSILSLRKTGTVNIFAVGLLKDQILAKHKTQWPTLLIVLQGSVLFRINSEKMIFSALDTYQIPIDKEHDVTGLDEENIFLIAKVNEVAS